MKAKEMIKLLSSMSQGAEVFFAEGHVMEDNVKGISDIEEIDNDTIYLRAE